MLWRSIDDMTRICRAKAYEFRALQPDIVVGIPRSGMLPATVLATTLSLPLMDLQSYLAGAAAWSWKGKTLTVPAQHRIALVEDATAMHRTLPAAVKACAAPGVTVLPCAVYATPDAARSLAWCGEVLPKPRQFEWNIWRSGTLRDAMLDIDGVLCVDPTREQKASDDAYRAFVLAARPKYLPMKPVGALATGRRECWRRETEVWLAAYGVQFGVLHMWDGVGAHADHKARAYSKSKMTLFIESSEKQSVIIAAKSKKPVLCAKTMVMI
jgi:hypothetical protein